MYVTLDAEKGYNAEGFVKALRSMEGHGAPGALPTSGDRREQGKAQFRGAKRVAWTRNACAAARKLGSLPKLLAAAVSTAITGCQLISMASFLLVEWAVHLLELHLCVLPVHVGQSHLALRYTGSVTPFGNKRGGLGCPRATVVADGSG